MAMTDRLCQNRKCRYDGEQLLAYAYELQVREQLLAYELQFHYEEVGAQNMFTSPAARTTGLLVDNIEKSGQGQG